MVFEDSTDADLIEHLVDVDVQALDKHSSTKITFVSNYLLIKKYFHLYIQVLSTIIRLSRPTIFWRRTPCGNKSSSTPMLTLMTTMPLNILLLALS